MARYAVFSLCTEYEYLLAKGFVSPNEQLYENIIQHPYGTKKYNNNNNKI